MKTTRLTSRSFPPYSYVPGHAPHPISDPAGHMHGLQHPTPPPLEPARWLESQEYLFGIDLFNHSYYWEAHEAWESLWHAANRQGNIADFIKGLIKLAAAGVKAREGNTRGVNRHIQRSLELLRHACADQRLFCGIAINELIQSCTSTLQAMHEIHMPQPGLILPFFIQVENQSN